MDADKLFFSEKQNQVTYNITKKFAMPLKAPETSLYIYKNNYFTSCKKAANTIATNMGKKHILRYRKWVV